MFLPVYALMRASILDFRPRLANRCRGEWFRLLRSWRQRFSASDSNFRSGKEEWPTASHRRCGTKECPAFRMTVADAGGDGLPRRRHNPKLKAAGVVTVPVGSRCRSCSIIVRRLPMSLLQRNRPSAPGAGLAAQATWRNRNRGCPEDAPSARPRPWLCSRRKAYPRQW